MLRDWPMVRPLQVFPPSMLCSCAGLTRCTVTLRLPSALQAGQAVGSEGSHLLAFLACEGLCLPSVLSKCSVLSLLASSCAGDGRCAGLRDNASATLYSLPGLCRRRQLLGEADVATCVEL